MRATELRPESVAGIVLDADRCRVAERRAGARSAAFTSRGIAGIILGGARLRSGRTLATAMLAATAAESGVGLAALRWGTGVAAPKIAEPSAPLRLEHVVDLEPPPPPPTPPPLPEVPKPVVARAPRAAEADPAPISTDTPPPPAQAAQIVAVDESAAPLDFTGFDISTGHAERYAGGVTASSGTNTQAVHASRVDRDAVPNRLQGVASRARAVGLPAREWRCPWPGEADALSVNEQAVVIRAVVRTDGAVTSAELISDPGYGFGQVALDCVREQRFPPATDDQGRPITATSPPIRVRFVRP